MRQIGKASADVKCCPAVRREEQCIRLSEALHQWPLTQGGDALRSCQIQVEDTDPHPHPHLAASRPAALLCLQEIQRDQSRLLAVATVIRERLEKTGKTPVSQLPAVVQRSS